MPDLLNTPIPASRGANMVAPPGGAGAAPAATGNTPEQIFGPGAALAPKPEFTPTRVSQGGSMVLGKTDLGGGKTVEEIRGTGHPSWQVYNQERGASMAPGKEGGGGPSYAEAVKGFHTEQDKNATELAKARIEGQAIVQAHRQQFLEAPGQQAVLMQEKQKIDAANRSAINKRVEGVYGIRHGGKLPGDNEPAHYKIEGIKRWAQGTPGVTDEAIKKRFAEEDQLEDNEHLFTPENLAKYNLPSLPAETAANSEDIRARKLWLLPKLQAPPPGAAGTPGAAGAEGGPWAEAGTTPLDLSGVQTIGPNVALPPGSYLTTP